jgi:hypothetical protein
MAQRTIEIFGVVDEMGGGGAAGSPYYRDVQFSKWREVGGEICSIPLYVREPCKETDIRPWMKMIKAGSMLHMEIRFTKQLVEDQLRGKVIRYIGKTRADKELLEAAKDKRPSTIEISGFAVFALDSRHDCYTAAVSQRKSKVTVEIGSDRKRTISTLCQRIQRVGLLKRDYQNRLLDVLERDLLSLKNEEWLDDGEKPVTPTRFRRLLKLSAIEVDARGSYEIVFHDGGLFAGHDLVVRGNLKAGPKHADLHG